jgi:hypothetical protein
MVDDATGTTHALLGEQETMWAAVGVCEDGSGSGEYRERCTPTGRTSTMGGRDFTTEYRKNSWTTLQRSN